MKIECAWMLCVYNSSNEYGVSGECEFNNAKCDFIKLYSYPKIIEKDNIKYEGLHCNKYKLDNNKLNIDNLNKGKVYSTINLIANMKEGQKAKPTGEDRYLSNSSKHTSQLIIYREKDCFKLNNEILKLSPEIMELEWAIIPDYNDGTWIK